MNQKKNNKKHAKKFYEYNNIFWYHMICVSGDSEGPQYCKEKTKAKQQC